MIEDTIIEDLSKYSIYENIVKYTQEDIEENITQYENLRKFSTKEIENRIFGGENLEVLRGFPTGSVDLIYLDPPFKTGVDYEIINPITKEIKRFSDTKYAFGTGTMDDYIKSMSIRLQEMHRILKDDGSIYLHCDQHASHYLKIEMDKIFGYNNFRSEIIWQRTLGHHLSDTMDKMTDSIFYYTKTNDFIYNNQYIGLNNKEVERKFPYTELETGRRFTHEKLEQTSNKSSKDEIRVINDKSITTELGWRWSQATFDERIRENPYIIYWTKEGRPRYKRYMDEYIGKKVGNLWTDILPLSSNDSERLVFPTQKPESLLERIIKASSNEDDMILDPFCGSGTTLKVAKRLKRRYSGIDNEMGAIKLITQEMNIPILNITVLENTLYKEISKNETLENIRNLSDYSFQDWVCTSLGYSNTGRLDKPSGADGGMDGIKCVKTLNYEGKSYLETKSWKTSSIGDGVVKKLHGTLCRDHVQRGVIVGFDFSKNAKELAEKYWEDDRILIELYTVEQIMGVLSYDPNGREILLDTYYGKNRIFDPNPKHVTKQTPIKNVVIL